MLKEDQTAELLRRCELIAGRRLASARGNLKADDGRASTIWELVCIDAISQIGKLSCEPDHQSRPDIVLSIPDASDVWIEVAYLYPRHWKNERRARDLRTWVYQEAIKRHIQQFKISVHISGLSGKTTGPVSQLPDQHEINTVRNSEAFREFFDDIAKRPNVAIDKQLTPYSVRLAYDPLALGPYIHGSGVVEESPKDVAEHALFRVLGKKQKQHKPDCPYVVCVGSDQSHALSHLRISISSWRK